MNITVLHRKEFGNDRFYAESPDAKKILSLMGRASFTKEQVEGMAQHGWTVEIKHESFKL